MKKIFLEDCCEILDSMRVPITASNRTAGPYPYYGANGIQDYVNDYIFDDELVLLAEDGGNFGSKERPIAYRVSGKCWVNNHAHVLKPKSEIDVDYLCFSLMFYNTDGIVNGATRQKLTQAMMRKMTIPYRELSKQVEIVKKLKTVISIKESREQELHTLDELIKARFVEMFESEEYVETDLINLIVNGAGLSYGIVQPGDDGTGNMGVLRPVDIVDGKIITKNIKYINRSIGDGYKKTELKGNELLITVRGTTGITALTDSRLNGMNVTRGIAVIRYDIDKINPVYLNTFLKSDESQRYIQEHTRGATLKQINLSDLKVLKIKVPSSKQQNEFADFVQEVDKSKVVVQKALDAAQLLFDSLMQQYFG